MHEFIANFVQPDEQRNCGQMDREYMYKIRYIYNFQMKIMTMMMMMMIIVCRDNFSYHLYHFGH